MSKRKDKFRFIVDYFEAQQPDVQSELQYTNAYQLLVATMLAAQCTDKRVNMVTPALFAAYPTPSAMAQATVEEILSFVKSVSYPNSKAAHLSAMSKMLVAEFGGEVPATMEELTRLPGVGRKTANVVASICFDKPVIAVDTHVFRVAHRLGLSKGDTPYDVEQDLEKLIDEKERGKAHHWLILHGRYTCTARNPKCADCGLAEWCQEYVTKA